MKILISDKPTYDLEQVEIIQYTDEFLYVKTTHVYKFEGVIANIINRSRVLRPEKEESKWIESVISATIDAGFVGHLCWKIKLTRYAQNKLIQNPDEAKNKLQNVCNSSSQLQMQISPAGDYYDGTNQTSLTPNLIFEA